jgi:PAS domain S-box-containing protein
VFHFFYDQKGQPLYFLAMVENITERKIAEQQLTTLTERLSTIVESLPVVPYTCQTEGVLATTYVGKNVTTVSGYQPKEFTSNASFWADHLHPDDRERVFENIPKLFKKGYYEHEYRFKVASGRYKWFSDTVRVIKNDQGVITHLAGVWQDITERKQASESLRESETRIRILVENMVDGVITIDDNGIIKSFNSAAISIFGYSGEEVIGKNVKILMPEPYYHEHDGYLEHYKSTGIAKVIGKGREVQGRYRDGSIFPLDLAVNEMWIGEQRQFVGIVRNITERKQAEENLKKAIEAAEAANRAKSEFLANMSHEIRTPMNAVIGFSELLSTLITDNQQKSYLDSIQTAGRSLLTLINDILDLSKIEAGRLDLQYEVVNPVLIFNELQQIFAIKMAEKNLEFIIDIDKPFPPALLLDEVRLRQVLLNLIGNAIKFTDKGYIKLSARVTDDLIRREKGKCDLILAVEDTGIGIPENQQALIFESFRQQEGQSTRKYGGTGLGLAITKRLVEMMNGQILVKSTLSQGSIFEITLRDVQVSSIESVKTNEQPFDFQNICFEKAQVLVIDDIESNRRLINEYLSKVNLEVVEAEDGQTGLLFAEEYQPNLILMDIRMPEMDGYEATRLIKDNPVTKNIPVIALTASVTMDEKANVKVHRFDGYLSKPVNSSALFHELTHYLKHTKKSAESPAAANEEQLILPETLTDIPVLLQSLEQKMLPKWQEIVGMIETNAVEEFAEQLIELGKKHHASILINYATKLRDKAQEFDIDGVEQTLEEFSEILDKIKK